LKDEKELRFFIENNIAKGTSKGKISINKNNFIPIYLRWLEQIKPIIDVNWTELKKINIIESDFYLADLFVDDNRTVNVDDDISIRDGLFVSFQNQGYTISKSDIKSIGDIRIGIRNLDVYTQFWKIYRRPPVKDFQDYIIERRDLLVPQDIRERKGAFFTPRVWVELSQRYIAEYLGDDWQDEYYVWDCASGTGNLLAGLVNKENIYASTLDQADINVIKDRIDKGANLYRNQVFQFDFLNDEFSPRSRGGKIPDSLYDVIISPERRKKLLIYINPPYAEATTSKTITGTGENKAGVTTNYKIKENFNSKIGKASNELFALFMAVIYDKMHGCILGQFSTLKFINGSSFEKFKEFFLANYKGGFAVPADTFDNVKGKFPIGFTIWNTSTKTKIETIKTDIYDKNGNYFGTKCFYGTLPKSINKWIKTYVKRGGNSIGLMVSCAPDFQHNNQLAILSKQQKRYCFNITEYNLIAVSIYFAVRHSIKGDWLNDRDQFLWPNNDWQNDLDFQNDCLTFTIFNMANSISSSVGMNNWIPFTEQELNIQDRFESNFMTDFINGKIKMELENNLFMTEEGLLPKREFSNEATSVFEKGRELWSYYHSKPFTNINASLYDIREHFQGRNEKGRMNSKSNDHTYTILIKELRDQLDLLSEKIIPKIYHYGFLLK
jgi:hypothetical protein